MRKLSLILVAGAMFAACNQAAKQEGNGVDSAKIADSLKKAAEAAMAPKADSSSMKKDSTATMPAAKDDKKADKK
jgi:hypothetical protein